MMTVAWETQIVDEMLSLRAAGIHDFDVAWARAIRLYPRADRNQRGAGQSFATWFQRMCRREWYGEVCVNYMALRDVAAALDEGGIVIIGRGVGGRVRSGFTLLA